MRLIYNKKEKEGDIVFYYKIKLRFSNSGEELLEIHKHLIDKGVCYFNDKSQTASNPKRILKHQILEDGDILLVLQSSIHIKSSMVLKTLRAFSVFLLGKVEFKDFVSRGRLFQGYAEEISKNEIEGTESNIITELKNRLVKSDLEMVSMINYLIIEGQYLNPKDKELIEEIKKLINDFKKSSDNDNNLEHQRMLINNKDEGKIIMTENMEIHTEDEESYLYDELLSNYYEEDKSEVFDNFD